MLTVVSKLYVWSLGTSLGAPRCLTTWFVSTLHNKTLVAVVPDIHVV